MKNILALSLISLGITLAASCGSSDENIDFFPTQDSSATGGFQFSNSSSSNGEVEASDQDIPSQFEALDSPAPSPSSNTSSTKIDDFIWKPKSERDGKLVVLVNPTNVRIVVTGSMSETLTDFGPSNDRGTTARGSFSGCSYGSNVSVEFFSSSGARIKVADGRSAVTIPDGCDRLEFKL